LLANWMGVSATCIICYDYFLTLPLEVSEIWGSKFSFTTLLFLMNRYGMLINDCLQVLSTFISSPTYEECNALIKLSFSFQALSNIAVGYVFVLRTAAIYENNWLVIIVLGLLTTTKSAIYLTTSFYNFIGINEPPFSQLGTCWVGFFDHRKLELGYSFSLFAFDTLVFILTFAKTFNLARRSRALGMRGLAYVFLRDGTLYYLAQEILIVSNLPYLFENIQNGPSFEYSIFLSLYSDTFSSILVSRLILNLKSVAKSNNEPTLESVSITGPKFAANPFIGNVGAPLRVDSFEGTDEEMDRPEIDLIEDIEMNGVSDGG